MFLALSQKPKDNGFDFKFSHATISNNELDIFVYGHLQDNLKVLEINQKI